MESFPDIVIVCEPDDQLPWLFDRFVQDRGCRAKCECVSLEAWGRQVSVKNDGVVRVYPDIPMLLRPLRGVATNIEEDRFVWNENFALVWSAAALCEAPVFNRPGELGWGAGASYSASITDLRRGDVAAHTEWLWFRQPPQSNNLLHQDLGNWLTVNQPSDNATIRSRKLPRCRGWEQVVVVDNRAWRATSVDIGVVDMEERSIAAARALDLRFACVSWAIPINDPPFLVRINPFPSIQECVPVLDDIFSALLDGLLQ